MLILKCLISHIGVFEAHKAKPSSMTSTLISDKRSILHLSILAEVFSQSSLTCFPRNPTHKQPSLLKFHDPEKKNKPMNPTETEKHAYIIDKRKKDKIYNQLRDFVRKTNNRVLIV